MGRESSMKPELSPTWRWVAVTCLGACGMLFGWHYRALCDEVRETDARRCTGDEKLDIRVKALEESRAAENQWREHVAFRLDEIVKELRKRP